MDVLFDYYPEDGPAVTVRVYNCSHELLDQLKAGHGNDSHGDGTGAGNFALLAQPAGQPLKGYIFPATRVTNVRGA